MSPDTWSDDLLSAYLDGELDAETRTEVEQRLAASPERRAELDDVRAARDAVRGLPMVDLSPDEWRSVLAAVAADQPVPEGDPGWVASLRARLRDRPTRRAGLGAAVAAAAVILAVIFVPGPATVAPKVATFSTEHATRASVGSDPVSSLAATSIMRGMGR